MNKKKLNYALLHPRYWISWLSLFVLLGINRLPRRMQQCIGQALGKLFYVFPTEVKHTTEVNLKICFPEYSEKKRAALAENNFKSLGAAFIESLNVWQLPNHVLSSRFHMHGYEHIIQAFEKGNGILLIAPHFISVEMAACYLGTQKNFGALYRPHKNPFIAYLHERFRKKHFSYYIPTNQIRQLLIALKNNKAILYAYDIDPGKKTSGYAPFFNVPAATLTTVSRLARLSSASVIPTTYFRNEKEQIVHITFSERLDHFPSDDWLLDATRLNKIIEQSIRLCPEQYIWQYKRFKTRPKGEKRFYYSSHFPPRWTGSIQ